VPWQLQIEEAKADYRSKKEMSDVIPACMVEELKPGAKKI
jgi:hypothetical protein